MAALTALHEMGAQVAHGALSPDRIIVTPTGDLVVTEYVFAQALERMDATPGELWRDLGVAVRPASGRPDQRGDIEQIGLLALAVLLGRPLGPDEYPKHVGRLLDEACDPQRWSLVPPLRAWLTRALALKKRPFTTAAEALDTLDALLPRVSGMWAARLLPQNLTSSTPSRAEGAAPGARALLEPPMSPAPAASAGQPHHGPGHDPWTSDAANAPAPSPGLRPAAAPHPEDLQTPTAAQRRSASILGDRSGAPSSRAESALQHVAERSDVERRLWVLCLTLGAIALLEAAGLVILLARL